MKIIATITCRAFRLGQVWVEDDYAGHSGQDFTHINGDGIVLCLLDGVVRTVYTDTSSGLGYGLAITTTQTLYRGMNVLGSTVYYGHFESMPYVSVGQAVKIGQNLGKQGSTGNSTGVHLHVGWDSPSGSSWKNNLPLLTGVPYRAVNTGGMLYDNDYNPDNILPDKKKRKHAKVWLWVNKRKEIIKRYGNFG